MAPREPGSPSGPADQGTGCDHGPTRSGTRSIIPIAAGMRIRRMLMTDARELAAWVEVEDQLGTLLRLDDPVLTAALADGTAGMPAISVSPPWEALLHLLARTVDARRVLEVGTLGGYSTIWLARALPADGRLVTLEVDPDNRPRSRPPTSPGRASPDRVDIRVGRAADSLASMGADRRIALRPGVHRRRQALEPGIPRLAALRLTRCRQPHRHRQRRARWTSHRCQYERPGHRGHPRRMNERIAAEPRLLASAVQTVGAKGYDGIRRWRCAAIA